MKALFLDFDGTIADSIPVLYQTYLGFLKGRGFEGSWEEFNELNGYSMNQIFDVFRKRYGFDASEDLTFLHQQLFYESYRDRIPLFDGTAQFLQTCSKAGMRMVIVTAATADLVEAFLTRHHLHHVFEKIITAEGLEQSKPDPAIYLKALAETGLEPDEVVTVEDSTHGIAASLAAHIPTIAIVHRDLAIDVPDGVVATARGWSDVLPHLISRREEAIANSSPA